MSGHMLEIEGLSSWYGSIRALEDVSINVPAGKIVTLLGANGAGKSTTLKSVFGLIAQRSGRIRFDGEDITSLEPGAIVRRGLAMVPEGRRIFGDLTARENLEVGAVTVPDRQEVGRRLERVFTLFPRLKERAGQAGGTFSGGEQQMLAIGRALMAGPRFIMFDEPSMGLAPIIVNQVFDIIRTIAAEGTTVLLVEQNARKALQLADFAYVLEVGCIAMQGPARELQDDDRVKQIYLGG
jgi:branched-chain amino acid transport system ATP-binding protein